MTGAAITPLHERWFVDNARYPVQFDAIFTATTWIPVGIAAGITLLAALAWRRRRGRAIVPGPLELGMSWEHYTRLLSWMPLVIGLHAAVVLLVSGVSLRLFFPNLMLPSNFLGAALGLTEIAIGLSIALVAFTGKLWNLPIRPLRVASRGHLRYPADVGVEDLDEARDERRDHERLGGVL
jgi:hypothetical protein